MFTVLVSGGRDFEDHDEVEAVLNDLPECHLIVGGARGADRLAERIARSWGWCVSVYRPRWQQHGKAAGVIRNQEMLDGAKPDLVLAFPGGRGTADMIQRAKKAGVPVVRVGPWRA